MIAPPKLVETKEIEIIQYEDGDVVVQFDNSETARSSTSKSSYSSQIETTKSQRFGTPNPSLVSNSINSKGKDRLKSSYLTVLFYMRDFKNFPFFGLINILDGTPNLQHLLKPHPYSNMNITLGSIHPPHLRPNVLVGTPLVGFLLSYNFVTSHSNTVRYCPLCAEAHAILLFPGPINKKD